MLEKVRGKRVMFVGDSVNRNQWESMVCLLHTGIAPGRSTWAVGAPLSVYSIKVRFGQLTLTVFSSNFVRS